MGAKKGKKAWRKIDTQDVDDFLEKSTREERQGLAFEGVPDADLFFFDKEPAAQPAAGAGSGEGASSKKAKKLTRAQAILQAAHNAKPVAKAVHRKPRAATVPRNRQQQQQVKGAAAASNNTSSSRQRKVGQELEDPWAEGPQETEAVLPPVLAGTSGGGTTALVSLRSRQQPSKRRRVDRQLAAAAAGASSRERALPAVPALEIDLPGCSYNPDVEQHQDAIAVAVAAEMQKIYCKDLEPVAPPLLVDYQPETDELNLLQVEEEEEEDEQDEQESLDQGELQQEDGQGRRPLKAAQRKTKKDRNREKRRREEESALADRKRAKAQRRDLEKLRQLEQEVDMTAKQQGEARMRRQLDKAERLAAEPPRLGKQRYEPAPLQVLTSDEVTGSLRLLKPAAMLAKDRFKALQRRGVIEPRRKVAKKSGKKIMYEQGAKWEREREGQQQIDEARRRLKTKKKSAVAS